MIWFLETTRGSVREGPTCFLLGLEVGVLEDVDKRGDDVAISLALLDCWTDTTYASMMDWICNGEPAVTFEMVQHASFRIPSLGEDNRLRRAGRAPDEMTT